MIYWDQRLYQSCVHFKTLYLLTYFWNFTNKAIISKTKNLLQIYYWTNDRHLWLKLFFTCFEKKLEWYISNLFQHIFLLIFGNVRPSSSAMTNDHQQTTISNQQTTISNQQQTIGNHQTTISNQQTTKRVDYKETNVIFIIQQKKI